MPELPEVEQLAREVSTNILGLTCSNLEYFREGLRETFDQDSLRAVALDQKIVRVFRRGKYLLIKTSKGHLGIHLGMSGRVVFCLPEAVKAKHTHVVLTFSDDYLSDGRPHNANGEKCLHFIDPRRFGRLFPILGESFEEHPFLKGLGVEPLDAGVDLESVIFQATRLKKTNMKSLVMDSRVVVGVGNIYASESLWRAKVRPSRVAGRLTRDEAKKLATSIKDVLEASIERGGTTFRDYRKTDGLPGQFKDLLAVYDREGLPCLFCSSPIKKKVIQGRSSFFCMNCQK